MNKSKVEPVLKQTCSFTTLGVDITNEATIIGGMDQIIQIETLLLGSSETVHLARLAHFNWCCNKILEKKLI
jgi:hypothetical protein